MFLLRPLTEKSIHNFHFTRLLIISEIFVVVRNFSSCSQKQIGMVANFSEIRQANKYLSAALDNFFNRSRVDVLLVNITLLIGKLAEKNLLIFI